MPQRSSTAELRGHGTATGAAAMRVHTRVCALQQVCRVRQYIKPAGCKKPWQGHAVQARIITAWLVMIHARRSASRHYRIQRHAMVTLENGSILLCAMGMLTIADVLLTVISKQISLPVVYTWWSVGSSGCFRDCSTEISVAIRCSGQSQLRGVK